MARRSQNRSVNASRRSSRLMGREEPEDASAGPPAPNERANDELLSQLVQQVQHLTAAIQDLRQPTNLPPPLEEPAPPSRHSRRSRPDPRSGRPAPHSRLEWQSTKLRQDRSRGKRPRSSSSEEFSTSGSTQSVQQHRLKEYKRKLRDLDQQVAELRRDTQRPTEGLRIRTHPPFVRRITQEPIPSRFKTPQMELYDGSTDPCDHLERYRTLMMIQGASDALMCLSFPTTLQKSAWAWYSGLAPESVASFEQLEGMFVAHFSTSIRRP